MYRLIIQISEHIHIITYDSKEALDEHLAELFSDDLLAILLAEHSQILKEFEEWQTK